ncbi:hypothetical protein NDU88_001039 [Pleurodeles waltl]|uniref:Uncharacterized protein n=1 Tax=Pleurodeles waltl TaxID=8319 RepID=A0AAV7LBL6_PLEWA|nr:hypothetical protein NDU88_001039 [Pleurodeles waltl]
MLLQGRLPAQQRRPAATVYTKTGGMSRGRLPVAPGPSCRYLPRFSLTCHLQWLRSWRKCPPRPAPVGPAPGRVPPSRGKGCLTLDPGAARQRPISRRLAQALELLRADVYPGKRGVGRPPLPAACVIRSSG